MTQKQNYKKTKSSKSKSNKLNKLKTGLSSKINKIIQGGGYYQVNTFDNTLDNSIDMQVGGTIFNNSNLILFIIILLLIIISYLLYINYNAKNYKNIIVLEKEINESLLKEADNIKKQKTLLSKSLNSNNNLNLIDNSNTDKIYNHMQNNNTNSAHPQYDLSHRFVSDNANNPNIISMSVPILNHNMERIINPLLPPERSYVNTYGIPTNIPSRGFSGGFQQVGSLHKTSISDTNTEPGNNNKSVILPLFGQPTYPGSNKWNYYTTTDKHAMVKVIFKVGNKDSDDRHGVNELMTGDKIQIPEYNGNFDVKIYQFDQPRYIPYIY